MLCRCYAFTNTTLRRVHLTLLSLAPASTAPGGLPFDARRCSSGRSLQSLSGFSTRLGVLVTARRCTTCSVPVSATAAAISQPHYCVVRLQQRGRLARRWPHANWWYCRPTVSLHPGRSQRYRQVTGNSHGARLPSSFDEKSPTSCEE